MFTKKTMDELQRVSINEAKHQEKFPIVIVLDNLRSMANVGSAFRTSDAFNVHEVILCGFTPQPPHREIHKAALGATESVAWRYFENTCTALSQLKAQGFQCVAVEQTHNSVLPQEVDFTKPTALVFGNEVDGVSDDALMECDCVLEIPQFGSKHSLNVSVSIGVVLWEAIRNKS